MVKAKDRLTAEEWFERANQFEISAHVLLEGRARELTLTLGIPHVVLRSFGVEAFLKCLIEMDGRRAPWDHNLLKLFKKLTPKDRRVLRELWRAEYGPKMKAWNKQKNKKSIVKRLPLGLDGILKLSGDAFVLFRYLPAEGVVGWVLMNFPLTIRDYILELKPELKAKVGNIRLKPEAEFVKAQNQNLDPVAAMLAELNRQAAPFNIKFNRAADPKDGGAR